MRDHTKSRIELNRDETRQWHDGPAWFKEDLRRAAGIKAYAEQAECQIIDMDGYTVATVSPLT